MMLYLHIPFCPSKCHYCAFYSVPTTAKLRTLFVDALCREIERRASEGLSLRTIYFGGGTPSILSVEELRKIFRSIGRSFAMDALEEVTLEANAEQLTEEYLQGIRSLGVERLSIGIQSLDDNRLKAIGRRHTAQEAVDAIGRAQGVGFNNISVDLIYGFEDLTMEEWTRSIDGVLELGVQHISAYQLSIEEGTVFHRSGVGVGSDNSCVEQYLLLCELLQDGGFMQYEVSNFALSGYEARHNGGYWHGVPYIGVGPSAHSYDGVNRRSWNVNSIESYLLGCAGGTEDLSAADIHNEYVMTRLRTVQGIDLIEYGKLFNRELPRVSGVTIEQSRAYISQGELFVADSIISSLFIE